MKRGRDKNITSQKIPVLDIHAKSKNSCAENKINSALICGICGICRVRVDLLQTQNLTYS